MKEALAAKLDQLENAIMADRRKRLNLLSMKDHVIKMQQRRIDQLEALVPKRGSNGQFVHRGIE